MSTNSLTAQNADGGTDPRPAYILAGTDQEGAEHLYRTTDETVLVVRDGALEHVEPLTGRSIDAWMAYVDDKRGWADRRLYPAGAGLAALAGELAAALAD